MSATLLHAGPLLSTGCFRLPADDPRWRAEDCIGPGHHLVFPGRVVGIGHGGRPPRPVDPTMVVCYNPHERYRRTPLDPDGDRCVFVVPAVALLADLTGTDGEVRFDRPLGPAGASAYAVQRVAAAALAVPASVDPLAVEERLLWVVADSLGRLADAPRPAARGTAADDAVEAARLMLATRLAERLSLAALAAVVHVSPFHLARRFRVRTGLSINEYRRQLRLRLAVERLCEAEGELAPLALELGFASHSHLSDSFRAAFGVPPSALRGRGRREVARLLDRLVAA
jgi:AraC-like DNA-binding protein